MPPGKTLGVTSLAWCIARTVRDWTDLNVTDWPDQGKQSVNGFVVTRRGVRYRVTVEREPCPPAAG